MEQHKNNQNAFSAVAGIDMLWPARTTSMNDGDNCRSDGYSTPFCKKQRTQKNIVKAKPGMPA